MRVGGLAVKSAVRTASRLAALALPLALTGTLLAGCAPSTSGGGPQKDEKTGTLRVWLFREVGNEPKKRVVDGVVRKFEKRHDGVRVDVQYIPVDSRAEKIKGAFNDPASAPDVIEYGNTDTAGYVENGGLADVSDEFADWPQARDLDPTAKRSVTVDGKVYGAPLFVGVRALYYRTDVFDDLGIETPRTLGEVAGAARRIHAKRPGMYGLAVGGAATYTAMPFIWAHGGALAAKKRDGTYAAAVDGARAKRGIAAYTDLFGDDNCPAAKCAQMGGNDNVEAFAAGKAGMAVAGDFNRQAMEDGKAKGHYDVVPLPGTGRGSIAPAFAGGNNVGVLKSTSHRTLAVALMRELAGKDTQRRLFDAMGFLPTFTDVREQAAKKEPFVRPFVETLDAGTEFVPATPAWTEIDAGLVLPTMFQEIAGGKRGVDEAAQRAARKMDEAFAE
ncbi:extracellular solute-binding protein [Streptomyces sp. HNM0575]|uniref:extracellular solute-binding protein n=1 Tax=Streptomyces sp. HNM0575 TaxID=2716338 RepID=UPI00145D0A48|nr:extracellular solute-binding protein [Streptomyces sp. HNM0575]NLU71135.1 extracellular solute-binding protein [Streptomyces sp. HNM0575]